MIKQALALSVVFSLVHSAAGPAWSAGFSQAGRLPTTLGGGIPSPEGSVTLPQVIPLSVAPGKSVPQVPPPSRPKPCTDIRISQGQTAVSAITPPPAPCPTNPSDPETQAPTGTAETLETLGETLRDGREHGAEARSLDLAFDGARSALDGGAAVAPSAVIVDGNGDERGRIEGNLSIDLERARPRADVPSPKAALRENSPKDFTRFLPVAALGVAPLGLVAGKAGILALNPWVLAGVAVAVVAVGVGAYLWKRSQNKKELWENSKSNQDIIAVEKARRSGDAETLHRIAADSRSRQARMKERLADARSRGSKTVEDSAKDPVKVAAAYEAFDGLAAARAELNANALSKDAARRIGLERPEVWKERVAREEAASKESGFEGVLAVRLQELSSELKTQDAAVSRIEGDLRSFDEHVPSLFKGRLKEMSEKGKKDLDEFKASEAAPEKELHQAADTAMRGRVSDRLGKEDAEFQAHRRRLEKLSMAAEGTLKSSVDLARQVDKDLGEMASHERQRLVYLGLASMNERVPVTKTDERGNSYVEYEDHSFTYKALAASEASAARASAASARAGVEALSKILPLARKDAVLQEEQLTAGLPSPDKTKVPSGSGGVFFDFFIPATWNLFGSLFSESQANQARARFGPVLGGIEAVHREVEARRASEAGWVGERIDRDLSGQMAKARSLT